MLGDQQHALGEEVHDSQSGRSHEGHFEQVALYDEKITNTKKVQNRNEAMGEIPATAIPLLLLNRKSGIKKKLKERRMMGTQKRKKKEMVTGGG